MILNIGSRSSKYKIIVPHVSPEINRAYYLDKKISGFQIKCSVAPQDFKTIHNNYNTIAIQFQITSTDVQALAVLSPFLTGPLADRALDTVLSALARADVSSVMMYQETVLLLLLLRAPEAAGPRLLAILRAYDGKGEAVASALLVGAHLALMACPGLSPGFVPDLVRCLLTMFLLLRDVICGEDACMATRQQLGRDEVVTNWG